MDKVGIFIEILPYILKILIFVFLAVLLTTKVFKKAFFGVDGADYREMTGMSAWFFLTLTFAYELLIPEFVHQQFLVGVALTIVLALAGIKEGGSIIIKKIFDGKDKKQSTGSTDSDSDSDVPFDAETMYDTDPDEKHP